MDERQSQCRLLASALHEMRNVLAVIRESNGLATDMADFMKIAELPKGERFLRALKETHVAVARAAVLADAMDFMAQLDESKGCDLNRVCKAFSCLIARHARGWKVKCTAKESDEPVWAKVPSGEALRSLLEILDICASVGGEVELLLSAQRRETEGIAIELVAGANIALVEAALTASPLVQDMGAGWKALLTVWRTAGKCFFLSFENA